MKNSNRCAPFLALLVLAIFTGPIFAAQTEVYLNIAKQANPKVKVIVAPFRERNPGSAAALRKIVIQDLTLSGALEPNHEGKMLAEAEETDRRADRVLFANWGRFGGAVLIKIEDSSTVNQCDFQVLAFSMQDQSRLLAKRYKAAAAGRKKLAHTMVNDLVKAVTGSEGIALSRIAFVSDATGQKELYLMDYDGDNVRRVSSDRSLLLYPRWSPDGKDIVAVSYLHGKPHICRIGVAKGSRSFVSSFPGLNAGASYNPDGKSLALTLSKDGNPEIYKLDMEDRSAYRLTRDNAVDSSPTWSSDGTRIAFVSNRGGSPQIYVMNSDGSNQRRVSFQGGYNTSPAWSPKGNLLAYCALVGKDFQIHALDVASGTSYPITNNDRSNEDPSWAADGRHIVYSSAKNYQSDIFMIDIYDQHPIQLTRKLRNCSNPSSSKNFSTGGI